MPLTFPDRRDFFSWATRGVGATALLHLLARDGLVAAPHFPAKAKRVVQITLVGGLSHLDSFDYKPALAKFHGQTLKMDAPPDIFFGQVGLLRKNDWDFRKRGKSGLWVSDLFPHQGSVVDELAILRSCHGDMVVHSAAQYQLFTGRVIPGFPSMGSWMIYGLGAEARSLPSYVVLPDPDGALEGGQPMYTNGFLPAVYQPTMLRAGKKPILNLDPPPGLSNEKRRDTVQLIRELNQANLKANDDEFAARINAYDLAFRMQMEAPEIFDLTREPQETLDLYGVGKQPTDDYARRCLLARRMVEKGVRFACVVSGGGPGNLQWDAHDDIEENHLRMAKQTDQPVAALIKDLKRRGMLDETLVIWGGEFGRSPESQGSKGRDHHNTGFSMWMAGGGIKGGQVVGATDAIGLKAVENPIHFRDVHTTILHQMGLSQHALNYLHLGRKERLTEIEGSVIKQIV